METQLADSATAHRPVHQGPWYVPDKRIRTRAAARDAIELAEWAASGCSPSTEPDEQALFAALHTCAFRVARLSGDNGSAVVQRNTWFRRWHCIREYVVKRNLGLVYSMLIRLRSARQDEDDRLSDAMFGLTHAVDRFNPWRGFRFSTYCCNAIARTLMRSSKREHNHRRRFPVQFDLRYEKPVKVSDSQAELYVDSLNRALDPNLGELTEMEARVITLRFLSGQRSRPTLREIGDNVGLSKERVRQIQNQALSKLRQTLEADPVLQ